MILRHITAKKGSMMFFDDDESVVGDPGLPSYGGRAVDGHSGHLTD